MEHVNNPQKYADRELKQMGAVKHSKPPKREGGGIVYRMPDGACVHIPPHMRVGAVIALVRKLRSTYGDTRPIGAVGDARRVRGEKPTINLERLVATNHAIERLTLMRQQAVAKREVPVSMAEIRDTLLTPSKVLYSSLHGTWVWVGHKIAIPAAVKADGTTVITTVLWATEDLWAENPRPS